MLVGVSNDLTTVSVFSLGFIGIWLSVKSNENEGGYLGLFFTLGIVSIVASVLFGLWSRFEFNKFFNNWGDLYFTKNEKLYHYMKDTNRESGEIMPEYLWKIEESKLKNGLFPWQFKVQICLFGLGIILLMFVLLSIL